ncbi:hypothetical protein [Pollutibacter soli]|uniref:hypothetical protein n=1 Tax=Pollutibacter soli TaxID=3034157 RepID=UPI003013FF16
MTSHYTVEYLEKILTWLFPCSVYHSHITPVAELRKALDKHLYILNGLEENVNEHNLRLAMLALGFTVENGKFNVLPEDFKNLEELSVLHSYHGLLEEYMSTAELKKLVGLSLGRYTYQIESPAVNMIIDHDGDLCAQFQHEDYTYSLLKYENRLTLIRKL